MASRTGRKTQLERGAFLSGKPQESRAKRRLLRVGAALTSHSEIFSWSALLSLQCRTVSVCSAQSGDEPGQYRETS